MYNIEIFNAEKDDNLLLIHSHASGKSIRECSEDTTIVIISRMETDSEISQAENSFSRPKGVEQATCRKSNKVGKM